ncbi:MAG: hypothetical protein ACYS1A_13845 [Planctomycetota bacterium]|jgi:hypothetical protein
MNHLTEEQFEDVIQGLLPEPEHLADCDRCKKVLAEKTAVANRLRNAFASVTPDEQLVNNIRMHLANHAEPKQLQFAKRLWDIRFQRIAWPAAAAVLVMAVILGIYVISPSPAMAAKAELVNIHKHNLSAEHEHEFYSEADPDKLAEYFKGKLGFSPSMPVSGQGMALRGCCVRHFRGQIVGSYVVDTPRGVMSVVVVTDKPQSLGMGEKFEHQGQIFWKSSFAKCDMVTVRIGDYSYCAVGEISHEYLTELLGRLI